MHIHGCRLISAHVFEVYCTQPLNWSGYNICNNMTPEKHDSIHNLLFLSSDTKAKNLLESCAFQCYNKLYNYP